MLIPIDFKVCAHCFTYNHAQYITDTLDGFAKQETDFPFVCVILDDCSTDATASVLANYLNNCCSIVGEQKFCEDNDNYRLSFARHIKNENCYFAVYYLKYNHYRAKKQKGPYFECWDAHSTYLAMCEGDDYWIDPLKLQKQVSFLDRNPDYGIVFSASKIYEQGVGMRNGKFGHAYQGIENLLQGNYFYFASILKRKTLDDRYKQEVGQHPEWMMGDWPMILHCAIVSKIGYIDEPMSVYRVLPNSASHFDSFEKFKSFNENSVAVAKWFIEKYNLDSNSLCPQLDNWLNKRLLLKACSLGETEMVNEYKEIVKGLSFKERIYVFMSSRKALHIISKKYIRARVVIGRFFK